MLKGALAVVWVLTWTASSSSLERGSVDQINQLLNFTASVECKRNFLGHCARGSVIINQLLDYALATQRAIQMDLPLDQVTLLGTHNSFNARSDNYGIFDEQLRDIFSKFGIDAAVLNIAQQEFTMTDTLNFGIRSIQLDAQWCFGRLRLTHAGNDYQRSSVRHLFKPQRFDLRHMPGSIAL
jgi:hypothetical protein